MCAAPRGKGDHINTAVRQSIEGLDISEYAVTSRQQQIWIIRRDNVLVQQGLDQPAWGFPWAEHFLGPVKMRLN